jgi:hypothetical protein
LSRRPSRAMLNRSRLGSPAVTLHTIIRLPC